MADHCGGIRSTDRGASSVRSVRKWHEREFPYRWLAESAACTAPEYHEFYFWIGDWDVFESGTPSPVAHVRVTRILGGCVLHEDYEEPNGARGQSFSVYDRSRKVWHQTWVTNGGRLLVTEGTFGTNGMILSGVDHARGDALVRGTWKPTLVGGVRETAVPSMDRGRTWKPWFDLYFHSRRATPKK